MVRAGLLAVCLLLAVSEPALADKGKRDYKGSRLTGASVAMPNQVVALFAAGFPQRTELAVYVRPTGSDGFSLGFSVSETFRTNKKGKAVIQFVFQEKFQTCVENQGCFFTPWIQDNSADIDVSSLSSKKPATARRTVVVNGEPAIL